MDHRVTDKPAHRPGQPDVPKIGQDFVRSRLAGQERLRGLHEFLDLLADVLDRPLAQRAWGEVTAPPLRSDQWFGFMALEPQPQEPLSDAPGIQSAEADRYLLVRRLIGFGDPQSGTVIDQCSDGMVVEAHEVAEAVKVMTGAGG